MYGRRLRACHEQRIASIDTRHELCHETTQLGLDLCFRARASNGDKEARNLKYVP